MSNILLWLVVGIMGIMGLGSSIYIIISLFWTIGYKFYRKAKYGEKIM